MITDLTGRAPENGLPPVGREVTLHGHRVRADLGDELHREIRTPLNTLLGFVYLALHADGRDSRREYLEGAERSALALRDVLNGVPASPAGLRSPLPAGPEPAEVGRRKDAPAPRRLLLVEDHEINRLLAEEMLAGLGYGVDSAHDGAEALKKIRAGETYAAVLMDLQMPVMDGFDATRAIRRIYSPGQLPVIAMTAHALEEEIEKSRVVGMNDYLIKPIDLNVLERTLRRWAGNGGEGTESAEAGETGRDVGAPEA
jgi:CheY-like chemotaxis protein